jgi:hypothetical protein
VGGGWALFKYLDIDGARKTLAGRAVKFSRPLDFNDPFDIQLEELLGSNFEQFTSDLMEAHFSFLSGDIDYSKLPADEYGVKIALMNQALRSMTDGERADFKRELMETRFEELYSADRLENVKASTLAEIQKEVLEGYGVFCASERHDSLLMWAHYAAKHTGVVLRFVPDAAKDSMFLVCRPVEYSKERPLLYRTAEDMVRRSYRMTGEESATYMLNRIVFTKSFEWAYERELRLAIPRLIQEGQSFELLKFGNNELGEVYFGCRIAPSDRDEIATLAKAVNPRVVLYQAKTDKREYALEFVQVG